MQTKKLSLGPLGTNCYLVWCSNTKDAVVVDPGAEAEDVVQVVEELGLQVKYIVNTHGHMDHIGANAGLQQAFDCPIAISKEDADMLTDASLNLSQQLTQEVVSPEAQVLLSDGDVLKFGDCSLQVLATPGHTAGGIALYSHGVVLVGDTLFNGSIGRSDFPGGDHEQLLTSIKTKLMVLPDSTRVLPGHGPETTIGEEKHSNPWLQG